MTFRLMVKGTESMRARRKTQLDDSQFGNMENTVEKSSVLLIISSYNNCALL